MSHVFTSGSCLILEVRSFQSNGFSSVLFVFQGDTPKHRAAKANDQELADYLGSRQHYQMIQREDEETAV